MSRLLGIALKFQTPTKFADSEALNMALKGSPAHWLVQKVSFDLALRSYYSYIHDMKSFAGRLCPLGHALGHNISLNMHGITVLSSRAMSEKAGSGIESGVKGPNGRRLERDWVVIGGSVLSAVGFVFLFAKKSDIDKLVADINKLEQKMDADINKLERKMDASNKEIMSKMDAANKEMTNKMDVNLRSAYPAIVHTTRASLYVISFFSFWLKVFS